MKMAEVAVAAKDSQVTTTEPGKSERDDTRYPLGALRVMADITAEIKRLEVELRKPELVEAANDEYEELVRKDPEVKTHVVGPAVLRNYTKAASWEYPEDLLKHKAELDAEMKLAQKTGRATRKPVSFDRRKDKLFSISVKAAK